jgi:cytochrome c5
MIRILGLSIGVLLASAASAAPSTEAGKFTDKQLAAQFYFDLGTDSIDVSGYPKAQQENYKVFSAVCSRCHTLARPISAPLITKADWKRFIQRMHVRSKIQTDKTFTKEDEKKIVEFLAYDSNVRKVQRKAAFDAETERLKKLFAEVKAERSRLQIENDQRKAKPYGDQPSATPRP